MSANNNNDNKDNKNNGNGGDILKHGWGPRIVNPPKPPRPK